MPSDTNKQQQTNTNSQSSDLGTANIANTTSPSQTPFPPFSVENADIPSPIVPVPEKPQAIPAPTVPPPEDDPNNKGKSKFSLPKFGGKKRSRIVATILGVLLLVGAVGAGVTLVQRNQNLSEKAVIEGVYCDDNGCDVGNQYPNIGVNHYHCNNITSGGCPGPNSGISVTLEEFVQSANFSENCGTEQIDVQGNDGDTLEMIWRTYPTNCQGYCKECSNNNQCVEDTGHLCLPQNNECSTNSDCQQPTPTPPAPTATPTSPPGNAFPTCSSFEISDTAIDIGDVVTISAAGSDTDGTVTHIMYYWAKVGSNYCSVLNNPWHLIENASGSSSTITWDTSILAGSILPGESVRIAANVFDNLGGWCTGNPAGTCGLNIGACPLCGGQFIINVTSPTPTPTGSGIPTPTPPLPTPTPTLPPGSTPTPPPVPTPPPFPTATPTIPPGGGIATCGQMCSDQVGIICDKDLVCDYSKTGLDYQGICVIPECLNQSCTCTPGTPTIGGLCLEVKAYEVDGNPNTFSAWKRLTLNDLLKLKASDIVFFTVSGILTGDSLPEIDKGRFSVAEDQITQPVWTISTNPNPADPSVDTTLKEFYYEYTIPASQRVFVVRAQIHDPRNDTWF